MQLFIPTRMACLEQQNAILKDELQQTDLFMLKRLITNSHALYNTRIASAGHLNEEMFTLSHSILLFFFLLA